MSDGTVRVRKCKEQDCFNHSQDCSQYCIFHKLEAVA